MRRSTWSQELSAYLLTMWPLFNCLRPLVRSNKVKQTADHKHESHHEHNNEHKHGQKASQKSDKTQQKEKTGNKAKGHKDDHHAKADNSAGKGNTEHAGHSSTGRAAQDASNSGTSDEAVCMVLLPARWIFRYPTVLMWKCTRISNSHWMYVGTSSLSAGLSD